MKKWLGLAALVPTVALVFMDQTILSVALPTIHKELNTTNVAAQWCVNAYFLALTVLVLVSGKFCDRMGARKSLTIGMIIFALSSFFCGMSPNDIFLIAGRALQGVGASLMLPAQAALNAALFTHEQRGRANGIIVSIGSIFMIIAPLIGGYLTEALSWRWIFWVNLPIAAIGLIMIQKFLPKIPPVKNKIDLWGFIFFALAVSSITLLFMQANEWGWLSFEIISCLIAGIIGVILLTIREKKGPHSFLDLSLFKKPKYSAITFSIAITQFIVMITVFQAIYFQEALELTPTQTGSLQFSSCLPLLVMPMLAGFLSDRVTPKLPIAIGYLCFIFSCLALSYFSTPSTPLLLTLLIIFNSGVPLIFTPSYSSAMSTIPPAKRGVGFGMLITLRMFSATLGLALTQLFVAEVKESQVPKLGEMQAEIVSFSSVHFALAMLMIVAFAITFILHRLKSEHQLPESPAEGWD